jgi:RNA polymerase sigma factor (sigma-70 family)
MNGAVPLEQLMVHAGWLRRFAGALVRDDDVADDVTQDALITGWQQPPASGQKARGWLAQVVVNQIRDLRRSNSRRGAREQASSAPALMDEPPTPERLVGDLQIHRALAEEVTALEEPFRETLLLRYYEGLSAADIARALKVPAPTVRWRLQEELHRLRRRLDARHGGERKRWMAALAPLVPGPRVPPVTAPTWLVVALAGVLIGAGLAVHFWRAAPEPTTSSVAVSRSAAPPRAAGDSRTRRPPPPRLAPVATPTAEAPGSAVPWPVADPEGLVRQKLAALVARSYEDFLQYADDQVMAALTKQTIESLGEQLGPRLARGYQLEALGPLRRGEHVTQLWKLSFSDGSDDHLLLVSVNDGRLSGFVIQ